MRIIALDYGKSVGVAIADVTAYPSFQGDVTKMNLYKYILCTVDTKTAIEFMEISRCMTAVMEDYPRRAKNNMYEDLYRAVACKFDNSDPLDKHLIILAPSLWKPVCKARHPNLLPWNPETQHEEDAMSILWYYLQIQKYPSTDVLYV